MLCTLELMLMSSYSKNDFVEESSEMHGSLARSIRGVIVSVGADMSVVVFL